MLTVSAEQVTPLHSPSLSVLWVWNPSSPWREGKGASFPGDPMVRRYRLYNLWHRRQASTLDETKWHSLHKLTLTTDPVH